MYRMAQGYYDRGWNFHLDADCSRLRPEYAEIYESTALKWGMDWCGACVPVGEPSSASS